MIDLECPKVKPIQICATHTRRKNEQFGIYMLTVLLSDGRIFELSNGVWEQINGPWMEEV